MLLFRILGKYCAFCVNILIIMGVTGCWNKLDTPTKSAIPVMNFSVENNKAVDNVIAELKELSLSGKHQEAISCLLEIIAQADYSRLQLVDLYHLTGLQYSKSGNERLATDFYHKAIFLYEDQKRSDEKLALIYNDLAFSYSNIYNQQYTIKYYKKAAEIWDTLILKDEGVDNYITCLQNLTFELINYGDIKEAGKVRDRLNSVFFSQYSRDKQDDNLFYKKSALMHALSNSRVAAAEQHYDKAYYYIDTLRYWGNENVLLAAYHNLFDYTFDADDYERTITYAKEALRYAAHAGNAFYQLVSLAKLATVYEKQGLYQQALPYILQAEKTMNFTSFSASQHAIQLIKAMIYDGLGDYEKAIWIVRKSFTEIIKHQAEENIPIDIVTIEQMKGLSSHNFIRIFSVGAKILMNHFNRTKSSESLQEAGNMYRLSAGIFSNYYLQGEYNEQINKLHQDIVEGLLATATVDVATDIAMVVSLIERNSSQHLRKEYERKLQYFDEEGLRMHAERDKLNAELDYYTLLFKENPSLINDTLLYRIEQQIVKVNTLIGEKLKKESNFNTLDFDVKMIMQALSQNQQLIRYYVAAENVYRVNIDQLKLTVKKICPVKEIQLQLLEYVEQLKKVEADYLKNSTSLFYKLMEDVSGSNITIIPESYLNYLPFESLTDSSGRFLGDRFAVSYAYSLPMWKLHNTAKKNSCALWRVGCLCTGI